jgi:hypothetical protein
MKTQTKPLSLVLADLQRAIDADRSGWGSAWAEQLEQALGAVEWSVHREDASLDAPGGGVVGVNSGQSFSPGLDRKVRQLHDDLNALLTETQELRHRLSQALDRTPQGRLSPRDFDELYNRAVALAETLKRCEQEQTRLILENVTTDIGAGD